MLPSDIETHEALGHLTAPPDRSPAGLSRRRFLQAVGLGVGGALAGPSVLAGVVPGWDDHLAGAAPIGPTDGVLVVILMGGGNDGLNMVVPTGDGAYYAKRGGLAVPAAEALSIEQGVGLHPSLPFVRDRYAAGDVAVIRGVGYPQPDLSHFNSMATWMHAWAGGGPPTSGWLGRWLDGLPTDPLRAVSIGSGVPLHLVGTTTQAISVGTDDPGPGGSDDPNDQRMYQVLTDLGTGATGTGRWGDAIAGTAAQLIETSAALAPSYDPALPAGTMVRELTLAARLVNADLGVRVIGVDYGSFDSHADQPSMHGERMQELNAGLQAFFATLDPRFASRTAVLTFSEFGRRVERNGSNGTDHGTASSLLLMGAGVAGGLHGEQPSLTDLDRNGNLVASSDFRSVFATVLDRWLDADPVEVLGGSFPAMDLFASSPGEVAEPPPPPVTGPAPASFTPLTPSRILDTRDGTGGRMGRISAGSPLPVRVTGRGGVPVEGVTAAVLNVTVTEPDTASYLTVYPSGESAPLASNLNYVTGQTVPNLVVAKVGGDGKVALRNGFGTTHAVADVVGYFGSAGGSQLLPLEPVRLLDTRDGTGRAGGARPIGGGAAIDVAVTGVGGVPATGVQAVVLNVTATEPSQPGFLTVWPTGEPRPLASNLNFAAGQTVPNLVVAKVGGDGRVSIANHAGTTHCVADVVGCFVTDAGAGRHVGLSPARVLDTRDGTGGRSGPLGSGGGHDLVVAGRGGVPASGATAVVLNLTVTEPVSPGYLTVYPTGSPVPLASNLNFVAGETRANLVVAKLGSGGRVTIRNASSRAHVVADVAGYFTTG